MKSSVSYQPLVSIITVVYNGEAYLEQTISSVLEQQYPAIEYIIIDGGSTDKSVEIIRRYQSKLAYWISEKDRGISDAFNKGLAKATGEFVGIINADDWYEPDTIMKVVDEIQHADIVYGDMRLFKNEHPDIIFKGNHQFLHREMSINHPTVFIRKKWYDQYGGFNSDYQLAMDYELIIRFLTAGAKLKYIPKVLANMRWAGASDKNWKKGCQESLAIKNHYFPEKKLQHKFFFYRQVFAIATGKLLQRIGLSKILNYYRRNFAKIKKISATI